MKKNTLNIRKNTSIESVRKTLRDIQNRCSCRTASAEDLFGALKTVEEKFSAYPTELKKLITVDWNACETSRKDYCKAYFRKAYDPKSTWFSISYANGWKVTRIYRDSSLGRTEERIGSVKTSRIIELLRLAKHDVNSGLQADRAEYAIRESRAQISKFPLLKHHLQSWQWMLLREIYCGDLRLWELLVEVEKTIEDKRKAMEELAEGKNFDWCVVDMHYHPIAVGKADEEKPAGKLYRRTYMNSIAYAIVRDELEKSGNKTMLAVLKNMA